jgi:hypothetical protein
MLDRGSFPGLDFSYDEFPQEVCYHKSLLRPAALQLGSTFELD